MKKFKTFIHLSNRFLDSRQSREMLTIIEKKRVEAQLAEKNEYMTIYVTPEGLFTLKHSNKDEAINFLNNYRNYYRQLWYFDKEKGAYRYVSEHQKGKEIIH